MLRHIHPLRAVLRCYTSYWFAWVMLFCFSVVAALMAWDWSIYWNATIFTEVREDRWHPNHLRPKMSVTGDALIELLEHRRLEAIELIHLHQMTPAAWNALAQQPLKTLKVRGLDEPHYKEIRFPQSIQYLDVHLNSISRVSGIHQTHLTMLQGLNQLKSVRIQLHSDSAIGLTLKELEILRQLPALERVYVDPANLADRVQQQLPRIAVRPDRYQSNRIAKAMVLTLIGVPFFFFQLHMLSLQFATPHARLIPHHAKYHLGVAGGIFVGFWCLELASFLWSGFALGPAWAMPGLALIPAYLVTALINRSGRFPGYINFGFSSAMVMFSIFCIQGLLMSNRPETDWMFQGHRPDWVIVLVGFEIYSLWGLYRLFTNLSRNLTEQAVGPVPFVFWNLEPLKEWMLQNRQTPAETWFERWQMSGQQRRLALLLRTPRSSPSYQSRLWRAGLSHTSSETTVMLVVVMSLGVFVFMLAASYFGMPDIPVFQSFGTQVLPMVLFFQATSLLNWRPNLA